MLYDENVQRLLKVYHFVERMLQISPECLSLIENALSGKMVLMDWLTHNYFKIPLNFVSKITNRNK
jgi:hypothetical protein